MHISQIFKIKLKYPNTLILKIKETNELTNGWSNGCGTESANGCSV